MIEPLIRQLSQRDQLTDDERKQLAGAFTGRRVVSAGQEIVSDGSRPLFSQLLVSGIAGRQKILADGSRQITAIHVPGDFMDLHGFLLKRLAHGVVAISTCTLLEVTHETLRRITETSPHLTRMLWLDTLIDGSVHREWIVAMGRRSALAQISHFVCEVFVRLRIVGLTKEFRFTLPMTQSQLADALGLSIVHVNRNLQSLRRRGALSWEGDQVEILDWDALVTVSEFDPTYLCMEMEPR
ncbi:Crp/Fnr family transcriptional regulator [Mesorhizobium sp. IMUNJ 23232]|uniref:Crp/Fnr family transcriptional regulator n=1 Tax=Mesorhizobium sp. IMUNJ 23232 TaxID=3376064 RepID=UPI00379251E0